MLAIISLFFPAMLATYLYWRNRGGKRSFGDCIGVFVIFTVVINLVNIFVLSFLFGNNDHLIEKLNTYNIFTFKYIILSLIQVLIYYIILGGYGPKLFEHTKAILRYCNSNTKKDKEIHSSIKSIFNLNTSILRIVAMLVGMTLAGSVLLVLVCGLPEERIDRNIKISSDAMSIQTNYPNVMLNNPYMQQDNWSDATLLDMIYTGTSQHPIESAFAQKQYSIGDSGGVERLSDAVNDINNPNGKYILRSTYWHGMRIFLIPLLLFKDYYWIRMAIVLLSFILLTICVLRIENKLGFRQGLAFAFSLIMLNWFVVTGLWSDGAPCLWVSCIMILLLLGMKNRVNLDVCCLFILAGGAASYFDWFSCPLITFGFPAIILIALESKEKGMTIFENLNILFRSVVGWCIGYGGMLAARIGISTLVAGKGAFLNFMDRATYNITSTGEPVGNKFMEVWQTIIKGVRGVFPLLYLSNLQISVILVACFVVMAFLTLLFIKRLPQVVTYFLISVSPFVWFIVFNGYCRVHYWIAYRVFSITVFSWVIILIDILADLAFNWKNHRKRLEPPVKPSETNRSY